MIDVTLSDRLRYWSIRLPGVPRVGDFVFSDGIGYTVIEVRWTDRSVTCLVREEKA